MISLVISEDSPCPKVSDPEEDFCVVVVVVIGVVVVIVVRMPEKEEKKKSYGEKSSKIIWLAVPEDLVDELSVVVEVIDTVEASDDVVVDVVVVVPKGAPIVKPNSGMDMMSVIVLGSGVVSTLPDP